MTPNPMYYMNPIRKWQPKKRNNLKSKMLSIITVVILASLPYSSTLSLPSGDPAPGRSPGPPEEYKETKLDDGIEKVTTIPEEVYDETTVEDVEVTTVSVETGDACAFARIPSDGDEVVTLSAVDSDVNLTVTHPAFEAEQLLRGVVYDVSTMYFAVAFLVILVRPGYQDSTDNFYRYNRRLCKKLLEKPHFNEEAVVGHVWREYYNWRVIKGNCQPTKFMKVTAQIARRLDKDMADYVEGQLPWRQASMLAKTRQNEMLMFRDKGPPGKYKVLINVAKLDEMYNFAEQPVKLQGIALKLLRDDRFLVVLDCTGGLGHMLCKANDTLSKAEVLSAAAEVSLGKGRLGCTSYLKS